MPVALEIVSPARLLLSRAVEMVVIPSADGDLGVQQGRAPMIVALRGGTITIYENGAAVEKLFVAGGFAEITPDRCTVLAQEALPVAEVSRSAADKRVAAAEAAYNTTDKMDIVALDAAMDKLASARAMVEAAQAA